MVEPRKGMFDGAMVFVGIMILAVFILAFVWGAGEIFGRVDVAPSEVSESIGACDCPEDNDE